MIATGAVTTLALGGAAFAYFTTTGGGRGSASVGASQAVVLHGATSGTLYPGSTVPVSFTADNPSNGHQQVGTIHLASIVACSAAFVNNQCPSGDEVTACESVETGASDTGSANFWMSDVVSDQDLAPNSTGQTLSAAGSLEMNDLATNQNACQNANLQLNFTS